MDPTHVVDRMWVRGRYCGGHSNMDPFRSVFNAASKEKEDFIYLNDRLSDLFRKMEQMRGGTGDGCGQYLATIACLEEEIKKLRTFYEAEISKQRSSSLSSDLFTKKERY